MSNIVTSNDGFFIENLNPEIASIRPKFSDREYNGFDTNILILDFGKKKKGDLATCSLKFSGKPMKITGTDKSCGCTLPTFTKLDNGDYVVTVQYDPNRIAENISKAVTVIFDGVKQLKINLIINRN